MPLKKITILTLFLLLFVSCDKVFEFSIYSAYVSSSRCNTTRKNLDKLSGTAELPFEPFKIAFISDSHLYYDDLESALKHINQRDDIDFVIHGGDMTDMGLIKEYNNFQDIMEKLNKPYFTVIGNHDCLANGLAIYREMFGYENYSFTYRDCKFVFFNDVVWELNHKEPDFIWLTQELYNTPPEIKHIFLITHIPPWTDQFFLSSFLFFNELTNRFNVRMTIHGHNHNSEIYTSPSPELEVTLNFVIGSVSKRVYRTLEILSDTVHLETVKF